MTRLTVCLILIGLITVVSGCEGKRDNIPGPNADVIGTMNDNASDNENVNAADEDGSAGTGSEDDTVDTNENVNAANENGNGGTEEDGQTGDADDTVNANQNDNAANENDNGGTEEDTEMVGEEQKFEAALTNDQEVPPTEERTSAFGFFEATLNADRTELTYVLTADPLSGPITGSHFHFGPEGESGPIVFSFETDDVDGPVTASGVWTFDGSGDSGELVLDPDGNLIVVDAATALQEGQIYVNLHTELNPSGEIRGQISPVEDDNGNDNS